MSTSIRVGMIGGALLAAAALAAQAPHRAPGDADVRRAGRRPASRSTAVRIARRLRSAHRRSLLRAQRPRTSPAGASSCQTCGAQGWTTPVPPPFAGPGWKRIRSSPPTAARSTSSRRARPARPQRRTLDIWRVDRDADGTWAAPQRLPEPVNSAAAEWFPRPAADGWLYFGSGRAGGLGGTDIWRARERSGRWQVENLGPSVNTAGHEYEPMPSPDGTRLIVATADGFYESRRSGDGWAPRVRLGPAINVNGTEIGRCSRRAGARCCSRATAAGRCPASSWCGAWPRRTSWPPSCPPRDRRGRRQPAWASEASWPVP